MREKNILLTGGLGFIGTNLCSKLLCEGHKVTCVDNQSSSNHRNLNLFSGQKNFFFIEEDVCKPLVKQERPYDLIFHLACPASPPRYQEDPIQTLRTCFIGTLNIANLALKDKARLVFSSTSEIYGDPKEHPQRETYWGNVNPNGKRSCYDEGKRVAETLLLDFHRQKKLDLKITRIFNTYGPHMDPLDGRVVTNLITQALKGEDLTVYGTGEQTRSFCYVDDMVEGLIKLSASKQGLVEPINLGNPHEITILELARIIKNILSLKNKIKFLALPDDDPIKRCPDIKKAKELLSWSPKVPLEVGLRQTIAFLKEEPFLSKENKVKKNEQERMTILP